MGIPVQWKSSFLIPANIAAAVEVEQVLETSSVGNITEHCSSGTKYASTAAPDRQNMLEQVSVSAITANAIIDTI